MGATGAHRSMKSSRYLAQVIANELILKETISGKEMKDLIINGKSITVENFDNETSGTSEKKSRRKRNNS